MFQESIERSLQFWRHPSRWAYAIVLPWALGLALGVRDALHFHQVAGRQRITEGQIFAHELENHNRFGYVFGVDGRQYRGWQSPRADPLNVGQRVQVFYDPDDPNTSALTDFADLSREKLRSVPLVSIGIGAVIIIIFGLRRRTTAHRTPP
jgi:hypothetical protein